MCSLSSLFLFFLLLHLYLFVCQQKGVHRTSSHDQVRKLVEKEGRTARNLVTWSVPVNTEQDEGE